MDTTISKLKVGERIMLGRYGVLNDEPYSIPWLKANSDCDFIAEDAVDYICFDAKERGSEDRNIQYGGNRKYKLSNLLSYLNSEEEQWYRPTHQTDSPPDTRNTDRYAEYESHFGFLYHFEEYELESLICNSIQVGGETVSSLIRLPLFQEIVGPGRFKLFHKKGIRPKASEDMIQNRKRTGLDYGSYIDIWLADESDRYTGYANILSRSGAKETKPATYSAGIRPVCRAKGDTPVVMGEDGLYRIKPRVIHQNICTNEELFSFLGITPV